MNKNQIRTFAGIGALGAAAILLGGCGGNSFSKNTYGQYPNTLPYAYGMEPIAYYGAANNIGAQAAIEGSGFQAASGGQAFITGASAFSATTAAGAKLPTNADPNATGTLPLGFSTAGLYVELDKPDGGRRRLRDQRHSGHVRDLPRRHCQRHRQQQRSRHHGRDTDLDRPPTCFHPPASRRACRCRWTWSAVRSPTRPT